METKLTVVSKDGLVGGHFHVLNDRTKETFVTNSLDEFVKHVSNFGDGIEVLYSESGAVAKHVDSTHDSEDVAECGLETSDRLKIVQGVLGDHQSGNLL